MTDPQEEHGAKHVRPSVRSRGSSHQAKDRVAGTANSDPTVEETRQRIESWTGIQPSKAPATTVQQPQPNDAAAAAATNPKGILREPKYSSVSADNDAMVIDGIDNSSERHTQQQTQSRPRSVVQDVVMERPKRKPQRRQASKATSESASATAIEGYTPITAASVAAAPVKPKTTFASGTKHDPTATSASNGKNNDDDDDDPLVFNSLADLMEMAGTLPNPKSAETPAVVETELSFSCMDPNEYQQEEQELEAQDQAEQEEPDDMQNGDTDDETEEENDNDDGSWDDFFYNDQEEEELDREPRKERAFLKLWTAISQWVTPQAVEYIKQLEQETSLVQGEFTWDADWVTQVDRSDVGASRCAGLMAVLQMHIPRCLRELSRSMEERRVAERRLADLLRCWDYSRPAAVKLDTSLSRALTCVLLDMVLVGSSRPEQAQLPVSCTAVGMNPEEYRYLTRSAIPNFGKPSVLE